jgi:hypothetical protein
MARPPVVHHADITEGGAAEADIVFRRRRLGRAAGSVRIGASHYRVPPYARQMPVHVHGDEEEIFYVLAGGGLGYELPGQDPGGPADAYAVTTGDVVVQCPDRASHTFLAGARGLELIAFVSGPARPSAVNGCGASSGTHRGPHHITPARGRNVSEVSLPLPKAISSSPRAPARNVCDARSGH